MRCKYFINFRKCFFYFMRGLTKEVRGREREGERHGRERGRGRETRTGEREREGERQGREIEAAS